MTEKQSLWAMIKSWMKGRWDSLDKKIEEKSKKAGCCGGGCGETKKEDQCS